MIKDISESEYLDRMEKKLSEQFTDAVEARDAAQRVIDRILAQKSEITQRQIALKTAEIARIQN